MGAPVSLSWERAAQQRALLFSTAAGVLVLSVGKRRFFFDVVAGDAGKQLEITEVRPMG